MKEFAIIERDGIKAGAFTEENDVRCLDDSVVAVEEAVECHFLTELNFGLPRFLCLMSMQLSDFPNVEQRLQGRDTLMLNVRIKKFVKCLFYLIYLQSQAKCAFLQLI